MSSSSTRTAEAPVCGYESATRRRANPSRPLEAGNRIQSRGPASAYGRAEGDQTKAAAVCSLATEPAIGVGHPLQPKLARGPRNVATK